MPRAATADDRRAVAWRGLEGEGEGEARAEQVFVGMERDGCVWGRHAEAEAGLFKFWTRKRRSVALVSPSADVWGHCWAQIRGGQPAVPLIQSPAGE